MTLHKSLTTVTTISKLFALWLYIFLPFAGFYLGMGYQNTVTSTTDPIIHKDTPTTQVKTQKWSTYKNERFNYQIDFPSNFSLHESDEKDIVSTDGGIDIYVTTHNPEECRGDCDTRIKTENTSINGIAARKITYNSGRAGGRIPQRYIKIVIPYNNLFYTFTVNELSRNEEQLVADFKTEPGTISEVRISIFEKMLSSLKITQQRTILQKDSPTSISPSLPIKKTVCLQDAKMCPDGSYVSRTGPNCEFAPCQKMEP